MVQKSVWIQQIFGSKKIGLKMTYNIDWTECSKKGVEYYTCKGCEDEVNRKGHLTKPQEAVNVENVKNDF